jgi:hypothetical protein
MPPRLDKLRRTVASDQYVVDHHAVAEAFLQRLSASARTRAELDERDRPPADDQDLHAPPRPN